MSNVQAVIAALNQQSNATNGASPTSNRRSKQGPDIASLRSQFGSSSAHKPPKRSSQVEANPATPRQRLSSSPIDATKASLIEQLEKVTTERDQLKGRLDGRMIDSAPESPACVSSTKKEISTLPPDSSSFCWFDVNDIDSGNTCSAQQHLTDDHTNEEDIINTYNQRVSTQNQQEQQILTLQQQLAACDIGTQWMMNKYVGELERTRLHTNLLVSIVKNQEKLINAMENNNSKPISLSSQEQQIVLLQSQLELQRMELDDKEDLITLMAEERDILAQKVKQLTYQMLYTTPSSPHHPPIEGERQHRNHPRTSSSSSTGSSLSSYTTNTSLSTLSLVDWISVNNIQQQYNSQSAPLMTTSMAKPPSKSVSPPQTPPPKQKLPLLPSSSSSSSSSSWSSELSPRSTLVLTPSSSPGLPSFERLPSLDYQDSLLHKKSMPDMLPLQDYHHQYTLGYSGFEESGKGLGRQKSFWKGWRNRLSG
ncbi:hypothetical protein [Absidia glauca]|uniref:Uncharacterized protein n=1 Tax=Absidia glauca TaxID=4829 RepID=A0A163IWJ3_ABSGL|nr:hypothetical protein [Absidia glauca]